jgi:hypothetical protein
MPMSNFLETITEQPKLFFDAFYKLNASLRDKTLSTCYFVLAIFFNLIFLVDFYSSRAKEHAQSYSRYSKDFGSERTPLLGNVYSDDNGTNNVSFGTVPVDADGRENPSIFKVVIKSFGWMWVEACGYKIIGDAVNLMQPLILRLTSTFHLFSFISFKIYIEDFVRVK